MLKEKNSSIEKIVRIIVSILVTIGINMYINFSDDSITFNGNNIIWLMICIFTYYILEKSNRYKEKRLRICSVTLGILFAIVQTVGKMTYDYFSLNEIEITFNVLIYFIVKIISYGIIFTNGIKILIKKIENIKWNSNEKTDFLKPTLKTFFIVSGILILAWLPYFLNYYPGIISYDTNYQLMQGYGIYGYSNHHPILHTLIITIISKIGYVISNNYNFGIAIYVILQMIACSLTFSFVIYYMAKRKLPFIIKILALLFFALNPIFPQFSISVWKDVPFMLFMILFVIQIIEIINKDKFFISYKRNILFIITMLGIMFFRNNGFYVVLLTFPIILIAKRKYYKNVLAVFLIPIIICLVVTGPLYEALGIAKSSAREMLTIPLQSIARISIYKWDELTTEEQELIEKYLPIEQIEKLYRPNISDPIKNNFNELAYEENKIEFFKLYFKLVIKYPLETLQSFISNTYGYYYLDVQTFPVAIGTFESTVEKEQFMDIQTKPILKISFIDKILDVIYDKEVPILNLVANIGFVFWIVLILLVYCIYEKKYEYILMYIPIAVLYLTCLASPVSGELRYIYPMFTCLPIFIGFSIKN